MDEKYIWPLVGVVLGWMLSLFASSLKERAENRRSIGRLVSKLLLIHEQVCWLKAMTEHFKDFSDSWQSYERMRKDICDRHFLEPKSHIDSLRLAIDEVSGLYPVEALSLQGLLDQLLKHKSMSLSASATSKDLYVRFLSVYEVGIDFAEDDLRKRLQRLALRHGPLTYVRVRKQISRRATMPKSVQEFVNRFTADSFAEIERLTKDAKTSNPSVNTDAAR